MDFAALLTTEGLLALLTLTAMETVLGIDNVVFISVLCDRLPEAGVPPRRPGLIAAMAMRVVLLFTIGWLTGLTEPLFALDLAVVHFEPSVRDLIMLVGGLVLMARPSWKCMSWWRAIITMTTRPKAKPPASEPCSSK